MIRVATTSIPISQLIEQRAPLCGVRVPPPLTYRARTDFSDADEFKEELCASKLRFRLRGVGAVAVTLMIGHFQAVDAQEPSRAIADMQTMRDLGDLSSIAAPYPVADFHEPLRLTWSKSAHVIRQAARRFSEQSHADY